MPVRKALLALLAVATVSAGLPFTGVASGVEGIGIPARVVDFEPETTVTQEHPTTDFGATGSDEDDRVGTTEWRVVMGTGNCCENHLAVSSDGRLFDIGGRYINYTDDDGLTWKSVQPQTPLINGEGSMVIAPNGDVLGIEWDAYTGDHLLAYKYNAVSKEWFYMESPIHHPFYDRPWISVVPGPFAIGLGADTVPYISLVIGGPGIKEPMFMSTDGLTYHDISSRTLDNLTDEPVTEWFPIEADASFDWIQPIKRAPVVPLGNGRAVADGGWLLDPDDRHWDAWRLPNGQAPPTFIQIDSLGRIHHVRQAAGGFQYRISTDNGQTWTTTDVPFSIAISQTDFHANAAVGVAAVASRISNQDWVYKFDITGDTARLIRRYRVGLGDAQAAPGVGQLAAPRFDFETVAVLPDGRVAVSFLDSTTEWHPPGVGMLGRLSPVLAIELNTTFDDVTSPVCTITGSAGDDNLKGTPGDDVICALGGDDHIIGLDGDDLILGGDGADTIQGNGGDDVIRGGAGDDDLKGAEGDDSLFGGPGFDTLNGGPGADSCSVDEDGGTTRECESG